MYMHFSTISVPVHTPHTASEVFSILYPLFSVFFFFFFLDCCQVLCVFYVINKLTTLVSYDVS